METKRPTAWKVGELAGRTGLSVRTLHYYDEIGLLSPSRRTEAGHRLYTAADVVRLQQIKSLRHVGLALEEIRDCLDRPGFDLRRVIELHLSRLKEQIELQQRVRDLLETIAGRLNSAEEVAVEELVGTITEVIGMSERLEKYYTREQLEELEERRRALGEERIRQVEAEWPELIEQVRAEMEAGTDPANERVQLLAALDGAGPGVHRRQPRARALARPGVATRREHPRHRDTPYARDDGIRLQSDGGVQATVATAPPEQSCRRPSGPGAVSSPISVGSRGQRPPGFPPIPGRICSEGLVLHRGHVFLRMRSKA